MALDRDFRSIRSHLDQMGFFTDQVHDDTLIVIKSGANRGLWVGLFENKWCIGTFIQLSYEVPLEQSIEQICAECLNAEEPLSFAIPDRLVEKCSLRRPRKTEHERRRLAEE